MIKVLDRIQDSSLKNQPMFDILITGSTGMVGKGVLLECLESQAIGNVHLINRRPVDVKHTKIREHILKDFMQIGSLRDELGKIDACFHCMGVSAIGLSEEEYTQLTFDITGKLADLCYELNPEMTFIYVSGQGTDSSERGRQMWARVKGRTENYVLKKGFFNALMFRPGIIIPEKGTETRVTAYKIGYTLLRPFFPLLKKMKSVTTTSRIGQAMLMVLSGSVPEMAHLENREINELAGAC